MSLAHRWWCSTGSTLRPMILVDCLSNSGFILAMYPSSVVQTGVKSLGVKTVLPTSRRATRENGCDPRSSQPQSPEPHRQCEASCRTSFKLQLQGCGAPVLPGGDSSGQLGHAGEAVALEQAGGDRRAVSA